MPLEPLTPLAVIPILPAMHSLLVVLMLCASGLIAGLWALRHPRAWGVLLRFVWSQKWGLLTLAAVGGLGVVALGWLTATGRVDDGPPILTDGHWPNRGGDRRHGSVAGAAAPADGTIQWVGGVGHTFFASPAVVGDRVYNVGFQRDRGRLFCWNARDGKQLWTSTLAGLRATFSSPVIAGDRLIVGEGLHFTPDASVFCVDLRSGHEGDVSWNFTTKSHVECTPLVIDDTVYIAAGDDGVYSLSLDANDSGEPTLRWHVPSEKAADVETCLCYRDGRLIVGLGKDGATAGNALLVLDAATGNEVNRMPMPFPVHGIPSITDGRMYVGMGGGNFVQHRDTPGQIVCIDLTSFETRWAFPTKGTVLGAIVCDDAGLLCGCTDGLLYALDHDGQLLGEWNSRAPILASPALTENTIFSVNQAGVLTALDRHRMQVRWETRLGGPGQYISSPVAGLGHVYVGTPDSGFVSVGSSGKVGGLDATAEQGLPAEGRILWRTAIEGEISAAPGVTGSTIVIPRTTSDGAVLTGLLKRGDDAPEWLWDRPLDSVVTHTPIVSDELIMVATEQRLVAIDAPTGSILWDVTAATNAPPVIDGNRVWIAAGAGAVRRWRPVSLIDGQPDGGELSDKRVSRIAAVSEVTVRDGRILRNHEDDEPPTVWCDLSHIGDVVSAPIVVAGRVYVAMSGGRLICVGGTEAE